MIEQSISHLMSKISLLYVIRNRSISHLKKIFPNGNIVDFGLIKFALFFPGPLAFFKKAVERVNSEKNILNR